ncbi:MAG TPA: carboxypeptidase regulatory-like domain-containing protein [Thermoanaerobaculia bacterium]|jgi:hypothetical protein|nr:carboxypeptidase regulatory-like domain-containing protein [Thermoanaerobaculia bacterium]
MGKIRFAAVAIVPLLAAAGVARAAETGSISGRVVAADGAGLPGATVAAAGEALPTGRSTLSRDDGSYTILRLPPGVYQVTATLGGVGSGERQAVVGVDRDTQLDLLVATSITEEITVAAARPLIDTRSAEIEVNFTLEQVHDLPISRDYKGLFQLAPGVAEIPATRTAPNAGGSRLDNTFLVDGVNITNPHYGDILPNIEGFDIAEVNLKRAGITAEFGRTGGMVVNAVTRSGSNDFKGRARFEYRPADWSADANTGQVQQTIDRRTTAASLGGPIRHDRLWFYGSASYPQTTTTARTNNLGPLPDLDVKTDEYFAKLTAAPHSRVFLNGAVRSRSTDTDNANITSTSHPSVATKDTTDYLIATFIGSWMVNGSSLLEGRYNHDQEQNSTDPLTDLGYRPAFNPARPDLVGNFVTATGLVVGGATAPGQAVGGNSLAINNQDFLRDEARLQWQSFQGWFGVNHDLRAGISWEKAEERLERRANGWGAITFSTTSQLFTANYISQQPPHTGRSKTMGAFVQDQVSLGGRTTLILGVLANRDEYFGEGLGATPGTKTKVRLLTFDWSDQIQPRLGITFVPQARLGDRLFFSAGRYYNTENKSLTRAASPTRIFTTRATFNTSGTLVNEVPAANTQNKKIDPGLDPMYTDEFAGGYGRPLGRYWTGEASVIYRDVGNIFEDVSADGLGNGPFHVAQLPGAYRRYEAATIEVRRTPIDDRWKHLWIDASYTWSRFKGNWDVDYANSLFFNSSILQDGPGVLITDNRNGLLRGDRTHVAKLFASIVPWDHLRAGTYLRYQSGSAWEARGQPATNVSSSYFRYLEKAGSRRTPGWLNLDLLAAYDFRLGPVDLELEGRVLNVFDKQVALEVDDRYLLNAPLNPANPGANPLLSPSNNPNFGKGTTFSPPRAYVVTLGITF